MRTRDHKQLGLELENLFPETVTDLQRRLFLIGCVEPDKNPLTYLKGSMKYQTFHGHNYLNSKNKIEKYICKLSQKQEWNDKDYYNLGKLMHYIADTFTFTHNEGFYGSLKEHVAYEHELHYLFLDTEASIEKEKYDLKAEKNDGKSFFFEFKKAHMTYLTTRKDMSDDVQYIYKVSGMILNCCVC